MNQPTFTDEQLEWLRDMMRPHCCHITGTHDPTHDEERRFVCVYQHDAAYLNLREALGFRYTVEDVKTVRDCRWCERNNDVRE